MDFKINNINFKARYNVFGKSTPLKTARAFDKKINKLEEQRKIALQAQEYLETDAIQQCIDFLPQDTFVSFHTGVIDREDKKEDEILDFTPFISFETKSINEQIDLKRQLGDGADCLKLSLNGFGALEKEKINNWFFDLIEFYCHKK